MDVKCIAKIYRGDVVDKNRLVCTILEMMRLPTAKRGHDVGDSWVPAVSDPGIQLPLTNATTSMKS